MQACDEQQGGETNTGAKHGISPETQFVDLIRKALDRGTTVAVPR